jgi:membrane protease YdiL (CAAX protease family)
MLDHRTFIRFASLFEVSLAIVAILIGWLADVRPTNIVPDARAVMVGVIATIPMIALYAIASRLPWRPLRRIYLLLLMTLGRPLSRCRWHELILLAALAGLCEELLFRGILQPWFSRGGEPAGWIATNLLFGLAHAVTPMYFVLATGIGFYLSGVLAVGGGLAAPIIAHALYDWYAFVQIARDFRRLEMQGEVPEEADTPADDRSESSE